MGTTLEKGTCLPNATEDLTYRTTVENVDHSLSYQYNFNFMLYLVECILRKSSLVCDAVFSHAAVPDTSLLISHVVNDDCSCSFQQNWGQQIFRLCSTFVVLQLSQPIVLNVF